MYGTKGYQICYDKSLTELVSYQISFSTGETTIMQIAGRDDLGIIHGLLYIIREFSGVDPFWVLGRYFTG
ncbi:hypothetical protein SAMN04487943_10369 [Gracilibacillus orientalis]|uniref:Uncharacterized protein n=1 Tax=Gracilibacillus orientalis TaxID=334253 RepID=A0A1I4JP38_9BACI|nr:hypothetical protein [Gracilibacillus orientalis]SFL67993.1 hypothetical protein SAMN04487943_10369 [Gracilibacillus orientalis]